MGNHLGSWKKGMFPMFLYGWFPDYFDADNYFEPFMFPGSYMAGPTGYNSTEAQQLLIQAETELDPTKAPDLYNRIQNLMAEDVPLIPGWIVNDYAFVRENVKGFQWCPVFYATDLTGVTVE